MNTTLILILAIVFSLIIPFMAWLEIRQFNIERAEWREERSKLLDRIQASSFVEYKAQERANTPIKHREKPAAIKNLESEPWL